MGHFAFQGILALSGDVFGCHHWGRRGCRDIARLPAVPRMPPTLESDVVPAAHSGAVHKPA